jgi:hypothetical protein
MANQTENSCQHLKQYNKKVAVTDGSTYFT